MKIFTPKLSVLFVMLAWVLTQSQVNAATFTSKVTSGSSNWSQTTTWSVSGGTSATGIPGSGDAVIIANNTQVIVDIDATCLSLTTNQDRNTSTNSLTINDGKTLTVISDVLVNSGSTTRSTINVGLGTLNIKNNLTMASQNSNGYARIVLTGGTLNIGGNVAFTGPGGSIDNNTVSGTGTISVAGTFQSGGTVSPTLTTSINSGGYYQSNVSTSGSWNSTSSWLTSYNGTSDWVVATKIPTSSAMKIVIVAGNEITVPPGDVSARDLVVNSGGKLNCSTNLVVGVGPFTLSAGATIITANSNGLGASGSIQVSGTKTFSPDANYEFQGAATGTFSSAVVNNLTLNNAAGVVLSGDLTVNGVLTLSNGEFNIGSKTLTLNSTVSKTAGTLKSSATGTVYYNQGTDGQAVLDGTYGNLTFNNRAKILSSTGVISIAGAFNSANSTGHTVTGSSVIFNGNTSQSISSFDFNNITINTGSTVNPTGNISVAGTFVNYGAFKQPSGFTTYFNGGTQTMTGTGTTVFGSFRVQGGAVLNAGSHNFTVTGSFNVSSPGGIFNGDTGTVTFDGPTASIGDYLGDYNFNNLTISLNSTLTAFNKINSKPFNVKGSWVNNGKYVMSTETVNFNGSSNQNIGGGGIPTAFYNLNFQGGGIKQFSGTGASLTNIGTIASGTKVDAGDGLLTLISTATSNANIIGPIGSGQLIAANRYLIGNVNVQSWFTGGSSAYRRSRFASSPIIDADATIKTFAQLQTQMYITGNSTSGGFDSGSTANTIQTYNETKDPSVYSYVGIPNINTAINPGVGFTLFYRGDRTPTAGKLTAPFNAIPESKAFVYKGVVNQGDITVSNLTYTPFSSYVYANASLIRSDGLNLVGNPYPCTIDLALIPDADLVNLQRTIYISNPNNNGFTGVAFGATFNGTAGSTIIQPGQGFFIQAIGNTPSPPSITFRESCKTGTLQPMRLLSAPDIKVANGKASTTHANSMTRSNKPNLLRINLQDASNIDETLIVFKSEDKSTYGVTEDASYMGGSTVALNSFSEDGAALLYNGMPDLESVNEIKLNVNASATKDVTLNFTDLSAVGSFQIFLKDAYLNKEVDVKLNRSYAFTIDKKVAASFGPGRFKLVFKAPEKVKILDFTATKIKASSEIKWVTENEVNTDHFDIERSSDQVTFDKIASIAKPESELGASTSNYRYTDLNPITGVNYYRLRQVDLQGKFTFTDTLSLTYDKIEDIKPNAFTFSVYPNPTTDELRVKLPGLIQQAVKMSVYSLQGLKMKDTTYEAKQDLVQNVSDLSANIYILEVRESETNKLLGKAKFIKQ